MTSLTIASQVEARKMMGDNLFNYSMVEHHLGPLNMGHKLCLSRIPFSMETLEECARTHFLIPDMGFSIIYMKERTRQKVFNSQTWYVNERFTDFTEPARWRLIRKTLIESSFSSTWRAQRALIDSSVDEIPIARQVVYMMVLHFLTTREMMFHPFRVRTHTVESNGSCVSVGFSSEDELDDGLAFANYFEVSRGRELGITTARKPNR